MVKTAHKHFNEDDGHLNNTVAMMENIGEDRIEAGNDAVATQNGHTDTTNDSSSDDDAPQAVQLSTAKSSERQRQLKLQSLQTASKQAKKQKEAKSKQNKQQKSTSSTKTDRKGKGRAEEEDNEQALDDSYTLVDEDNADAVEEDTQPKKLAKRHRVFNDEDADNNEPTTSSSTPRLDPALFQQAEAAFEDAKRRALQEQRSQQQNINEARLDNASVRSRKRSRKQNGSHGTATKVIGDTVIQQLASTSTSDQASIDSTTALTSKRNESFLKDRLFKRKKARLTKSTTDKSKSNKEEKPFLLFDPLLDKPTKTKAAKPLTRSELEDRLRHRKSAEKTFSKSQRKTLGPSIAFASSTAKKTGRAF